MEIQNLKNKYKLLKIIGSGEKSVVYKACLQSD